MNILHISDSHCLHEYYSFDLTDVDVLIHSGDCSNSKKDSESFREINNFMYWYSELPVKHKIFVAGNHDSTIEKKLITKQDFENLGIIYLEMESVVIDGVKFYGTPYTPTYGEWSFMKPKGKLQPIYNQIDEDVNVLISHGPPYGILDLSYNRKNELEFCGCKELRNRISELPDLQMVAFGHIHSTLDIINTGIRISNRVTYSNASSVMDGRFERGITFNGNIINL